MYSIKSKKKTRGTASKIANDTFRSENIIPQAFSVGKMGHHFSSIDFEPKTKAKGHDIY